MSRRALHSFIPFVVVFISTSSIVFAQDTPFASFSAESPASEGCQTMPANVDGSTAARQLFAVVAEMSATFRRQCAAVSRAPHLRVVVHLVGRLPTSAARAATEIWRRPGNRIMAYVNIPVSFDSAELLAHEFEHLVEQIDGVCLSALVKRGEPGVTQSGSGAYETFRAKKAGRQVAREIEQTARSRRELLATAALR